MTYFKRIILTAFIFLSANFQVSAQSNSLYHLRGIPQSTEMNPAFQPKCNVWIGIPYLHSTYINAGNNSLSYSNFLRSEGDSMISAFNRTRGFKDDLLNSFKPVNILSFNYHAGIINFGFRFKSDWYFTYNMNLKQDFMIGYPKEFAQFLLYGNASDVSMTDPGLKIPMKHFGIDQNMYMEHAFGLSKEINENLTVGGRIKLIQGLINIHTKSNDATLNASTDEWSLDKDFEVYASSVIPDMLLEEDDLFGFNQDIDFTKISANNAFKNMGLGLDLGVDYRVDDRLSFSASLIDFGYIHWNQNTSYNLKLAFDTAYKGVYVTPNLVTNIPVYGQATLDTMFSSVMQKFKMKGGSGAYNTYLSWKVYTGASYYIVPDKISIGLLSRTERHYKKFFEYLTLSANFFPTKGISLTTSYTFLNNTFSNMGAGANVKVGPFNFFFLGDYWPMVFSGDYFPYKQRIFNFHSGITLSFGCGKKIKDKPMVDAY